MQYYAIGLCDHNHIIAWEGVFMDLSVSRICNCLLCCPTAFYDAQIGTSGVEVSDQYLCYCS